MINGHPADNSVNDTLQNLSLNEQEFNPGTVLKEKNNSNEYILLGYDQSRENMICSISSFNTLNNNIYIINKNNVEKIVKINTLPAHTRFVFE